MNHCVVHSSRREHCFESDRFTINLRRHCLGSREQRQRRGGGRYGDAGPGHIEQSVSSGSSCLEQERGGGERKFCLCKYYMASNSFTATNFSDKCTLTGHIIRNTRVQKYYFVTVGLLSLSAFLTGGPSGADFFGAK